MKHPPTVYQAKIKKSILPSSDEEEKGEDDEEGKTAHCRGDEHQHLALVRRQVWSWRKKKEGREEDKYKGGG